MGKSFSKVEKLYILKENEVQRGWEPVINREDILSMEYLKKTEYTACHQGMRYRLEGAMQEEKKVLKVTVWPEPFNYFNTKEEDKTVNYFSFDEDGILDAIRWMNQRLFEDKEKWENAPARWSEYDSLSD